MIKDEYMDNINSAIKRKGREIKESRLMIKNHQKNITNGQEEMARLRNCKKVIQAYRKDPSFKCDHSEDEFNHMMLCVDSGIGYAGKYCPLCGTLENHADYPAIEMRPLEPFKKDCVHIYVTYHNIIDTYGHPILSVYGQWCSVCGCIDMEG